MKKKYVVRSTKETNRIEAAEVAEEIVETVRRHIKLDVRAIWVPEALVRLCDLICRLFLMLQAALSDCLFLDFFPFSDNGFIAAKVDVGGCDVVDALVVALMIVMIDKGLEITGQTT